MVIEVRCSNPDCGRTSRFGDDGLRRVFRCPGCRRKLTAAVSASGARRRDAIVATMDEDEGTDFPDDPMALELAIPLGRLQLRDKLGSGSFATTYHAFDPLLERDVALKVFHPGDEARTQDVAHFVTEAKALARLRHPRIAPIYDAGHDGGYHYIAMAYIAGRTLAQTLSEGPLGYAAAARIAITLAEALDHAHGRGIVHRDVKPSNIVLDEHGAPHLIDFGLAHGPDRERALGPTGLIRGTPAYLAPEQARGIAALPEPANDQYSLGAVLYELICGRPPFMGPRLAVLVSVLRDDPPRPSTLNPNVPPALEAICLKTLAKRPEDRYPSCKLLAEDLQRWLRSEPTRTAHARPERGRVGWFQRVRGVASAFLAVLISIVLIVTVWQAAGLF
jgi:serine/threonine protein kinase